MPEPHDKLGNDGRDRVYTPVTLPDTLCKLQCTPGRTKSGL